MDRRSWFNRNIVILGLTSFWNDLSSEMIQSVLPAFFISVLKAGAGSLGLLGGLTEGLSNIIKLFSGHFSDMWQRRKPLVVLGYALSVATRPFYMLIGSVSGTLGIFTVDRIGKGLRDSPRDAIISFSTPKSEIGRAFGFHRALDTLGAIIGPLVVYLILLKYPSGFDIVFVTAFLMGLLAVFTVLFIADVKIGIQNKRISFPSLTVFSANFKKYLVSLLFLSLGSLPIAVLLLKTQNIGLAVTSIPLFYLIYNISFACFSFFGGKLSDRIGAKKVIIIGYLLLIISYIFLALAAEIAVLVIGFFVLGLFPALTDGVQRAFVSGLSEDEHRGGAIGYVNAISGIGLLFAGIGSGFIW